MSETLHTELDAAATRLVEITASVRADPSLRPLLLPLLFEENEIFRGKGTRAIVRMRGWILATYEHVGLPQDALAFVIEELETGVDSYLMAAAARALRGAEERSPALSQYLMRAVRNLLYRDDAVSFEFYGARVTSAEPRTALAEVFATLGCFGASSCDVLAELESIDKSLLAGEAVVELQRAIENIRGARDSAIGDCCLAPNIPGTTEEWSSSNRREVAALTKIQLQDQDGRTLPFARFFHGKPAIVAFFYTRCSNAQKCPTTIAKLSRLQQKLKGEGLESRVRIAAISYDADYDNPERLRAYGEERSFSFNADHRLMRVARGGDELRRTFALGVSFVESIVSRHRLELFMLDRRGRIAASFTRLEWDEIKVLEKLHALDAESALDPSPIRALLNIVPALVIAVFPKCPFCWAAYLSVLGIAGIERIPYSPWLIPAFGILAVINLASSWLRVRRGVSAIGFHVSLLALGILGVGIIFEIPYAPVIGVALNITGSLLNMLRRR